ncbi:membrane protein [Methylomagnum ishizawai]|nr:membrane protein [Methylomagnum ishizawai]
MIQNTFKTSPYAETAGMPAVRFPAWALGLLMASTALAGEPEPGAEDPAKALELPDVEVVGITPLPTLGLPASEVPGNVQSVEDEQMDRQESLNLPRFMNRNLNSVNINDVQSNPWQPDVTYRGFSASPLIGTPIGLAVYQDGVRINEPFGDTVNWDLIPQSAIANLDLIPGSNPLFGLNALGGSLSIRTKSGRTHAGTQAEFNGGSFGRKTFEFEHGGSKDEFDWFVTGNVAENDGWRDHSHSNVHQLFVKLGWENETTDVDLSYTFANNSLTGNGPLPYSLLQANRNSVYTYPDTTKPDLSFLNLKASHEFSKDWLLAGNAYYRSNVIDTFNGDVAEDCEQFATYAECLNEDGELSPSAVNRRSRSNEDGTGAQVQLSYLGDLFALKNNFTFGTSYDYGHTDFTQSEQAAAFTSSRGTVGLGAAEQTTHAKATNQYVGVFATDTLSPTPWLHFNAAGRWNQAEIELSGYGTDEEGGRTSLAGHHTFNRLNPSAGFTLQPLDAFAADGGPVKEMTFYGNYNEGFRVPTPVELTCADPEAPCSLPNSFIADPPLKPVVSNTFEVGLRGKLGEDIRWTTALYRTELSNDIMFINVGGSGLTRGYFQNVGNTLRQGAEVGLQGGHGGFNWYINYSFIDATYQTHATLQNALGPETVSPGDRIPGIPQQLVKLGAEYEILDGWFFGGDLQYASSQYLRGDDQNVLPQVPEYTVVNLHTRYKVEEHVELFAMANNVFNTDYSNFGVVNRNFFTGAPDGGTPERFLGPGAPIGAWAGVRVHFD